MKVLRVNEPKRANRSCFAAFVVVFLLFVLNAPTLAVESPEPGNEDPQNKGALFSTQLGQIQGFKGDGVLNFLGIPYAAPPINELRFQAPTQPESWDGVLAATTYPNRCTQPNVPIFGEQKGDVSEDCLFLNITTPSVGGEKRPVLFWIHGGSLTSGSANDYNGSMLSKQGNVVVVTINYRLGLLGFLDLSSIGSEYDGSASNGIRDQVLALEWVRDNISDYGGNPKNVTIFGESAGGFSILALLATPAADGLYHKAIAHSPRTAESSPSDHLNDIIEALSLNTEDVLDSILKVTPQELMAVQESLGGVNGGIDGTVVTRSTLDAIEDMGDRGVPLIAGSNLDEGKLFTAIYRLAGPDFELPNEDIARMAIGDADPTTLIDGLRELHPKKSELEIHLRIWDIFFRRPAIQVALQSTNAGPGGWLYQFNFPTTTRFLGQDIGAGHAVEIAFTFNRYNTEDPGLLALNDPKDPVVRNLSQRWSDTVIQFAKTGNPNGAGLPNWPKYDAENRYTLVIDAESRIESDLNREERLLWESVSEVN